jgi:hypothetical protein
MEVTDFSEVGNYLLDLHSVLTQKTSTNLMLQIFAIKIVIRIFFFLISFKCTVLKWIFQAVIEFANSKGHGDSYEYISFYILVQT